MVDHVAGALVIDPVIIANHWAAVTPADICWVMRTRDRSVLTPPRTNYLGATLRALEVSSPGGWGDLRLVDSAPSGDLPWWGQYVNADANGKYPHIVETDRPLTNNQNAHRALLLGAISGHPWIVHLEDDIDVCADIQGSIARWLTDYADPRYHLFTFHTPYSQVTERHKVGLQSWEYPIRAFYGNQCWAMRRADAVSSADWIERAIPKWRSGQGFDLMLKEWAKATYPEQEYFLASCPSFVQHVGVESSLHLGRFHKNQSWLGPNWTYVGRGR